MPTSHECVPKCGLSALSTIVRGGLGLSGVPRLSMVVCSRRQTYVVGKASLSFTLGCSERG